MDIASALDATLSINSIILPGGENRKRNEKDILQMRNIFVEGDLISVFVHGGLYRRLKYRKWISLVPSFFIHVLPSMASFPTEY